MWRLLVEPSGPCDTILCGEHTSHQLTDQPPRWLKSQCCWPVRVLGSVPELEEGADSLDDDLGPDGWDDVLSAWMGSAGLPDVWSGAAASAHSPATSTSHSPARQESPALAASATTADMETPTPVRGSHAKPPVGPSSGRSSLDTKPVSLPCPLRVLQLCTLPQSCPLV